MWRRIIQTLLNVRSASTESTGDRQSGGINIDGAVHAVQRDMIGRDKIEINFAPAPGMAAQLDAALALIGNASNLISDLSHDLMASRKATQATEQSSFWLREALEPLHAAMSTVHEIYVASFRRVETILRDDEPSTLPDALDFLSKRHLETRAVRESLQAMRISISGFGEAPDEIRHYLSACERYFSRATGTAVSSPMRGLLEQISTLAIAERKNRDTLEASFPSYGGQIDWAAKSSVGGVLISIEEDWPQLLGLYYTGRLRLLQRLQNQEEVSRLIHRATIFKSGIAYSQRIGQPSDKYEAELADVSENLKRLTE